MGKNIGIILAGGAGVRMSNMNMPKQFADVYGKPVVVHTLEIFDLHMEIDEIIIVCKEDYIDDMKILVRKFDLQKVKAIVKAGATRQESSYNGILAVQDTESVLVIHDAVRPLVSARIISENIRLAREHGAVDTVVPANDTIVRSLDGLYMNDVPNRSELYQGQTPQSFKYSVIREAHEMFPTGNSTDDCQLLLKAGKKVALVTGDKLNFKITTQEDLVLLKALVKMSRLERI